MGKATYFDDFLPFQRAEHFNTWTTSNCQNFRRCDDYMKVIFRCNRSRLFQGEEAHQANQPCLDLIPNQAAYPVLAFLFCLTSQLPDYLAVALKVPVAALKLLKGYESLVSTVTLRGTLHLIVPRRHPDTNLSLFMFNVKVAFAGVIISKKSGKQRNLDIRQALILQKETTAYKREITRIRSYSQE